MQCASPQQLYNSPDNLFVGQFIGSPSMNVMKSTVIEVDKVPALKIGAQTLTLSPEALVRLPGLASMVGRDVAFGVRPEALGHEGTGSLDVKVELVEMLGAELLVHATIDSPMVKQTDDGIEVGTKDTSMIIVSMDPRHMVAVGDRVTLPVDTARIHLFDMATGDAVGFKN